MLLSLTIIFGLTNCQTPQKRPLKTTNTYLQAYRGAKGNADKPKNLYSFMDVSTFSSRASDFIKQRDLLREAALQKSLLFPDRENRFWEDLLLAEIQASLLAFDHGLRSYELGQCWNGYLKGLKSRWDASKVRLGKLKTPYKGSYRNLFNYNQHVNLFCGRMALLHSRDWRPDLKSSRVLLMENNITLDSAYMSFVEQEFNLIETGYQQSFQE